MGEVFAGRYELLDLIGEGGMGSVWRVHDRREDRIVAAKVLRQSDAVSLLRFVREQAVRVAHPHVVTPLGWAGEDDRVLFTMPVVEGGSIATLVGDHGPLPPLVVAELVRQLLDALSAVHAAQLVHRDVKPGNVLLAATGPGRPHSYLTDFGIAVDLNGPRLTQTGHWSGTPGYAAPESQLGAEPAPTEDLYSAGLVGLAMLTGGRPTLPVPRPAGVPEPLWSLLDDLVRPDPDDRPVSAAAAAARLEAPELAWTESAMGEVEVLRQVGEVLAGAVADSADDERTTVRRPVGGPERATATMGGTDAHAGRGTSTSRRPAAVGLAGLAAVAALSVLLWSPWSGGSGGEGGSTPPQRSSTAGTTADTTATASTTTVTPTTGTTTRGTTTGADRPTPTAPPTATGGTVRVGTVVVRVGQACSFTEVGVRETTVSGVAVVCQRGQGGSYAWERP